MSMSFWIRRYLKVSAIAVVLIALVQMLKGMPTTEAAVHGLLWGVITGAVFTLAHFWRVRRAGHCAICETPPETVERH